MKTVGIKFPIHCSAVAFLTLLLVAAPTLADSPDSIFKRAKNALRHHENAKARPLLIRYLDAAPKGEHAAEALYRLAEIEMESKPVAQEQAGQRLRRLQKNFPNSSWARRDDTANLIGRLLDHRLIRFGHRSPIPVGKTVTHRTWHDNDEPPHEVTLTIYRVKEAAHRRAERTGGLSRAELDPDDWQQIEAIDVALENRQRWFKYTFDKPGLYVLRERINGLWHIQTIRVVDFNITAKRFGSQLLVHAMGPRLENPRKNLSLTVAPKFPTRHKDQPTAETTTDARGLAVLDLPPALRRMHQLELRVEGERDFLYLPVNRHTHERHLGPLAHIATDRPIYRPNDTVRFKLTRRDRVGDATFKMPTTPHEGEDEASEPRPRHRAQAGEIRVRISDPHGSTRTTQILEWNEHGTASGRFKLGKSPRTGEYNITVEGTASASRGAFHGRRHHQHTTFRVEPYRKPKMRVNVTFPGGAAPPGETGKARVKADYFFGGPVKNATVEWTLAARWRRQPQRLRFRVMPHDPRRWYLPTESAHHDWWSWPMNEADELVTGTAKTNDKGVADIRFDVPADVPWYFDQLSLRATVRDASELTAEAAATAGRGATPARLRIGTDRLFYQPGKELRAAVKAVDANGDPIADRRIALTYFKQLQRRGQLTGEFESLGKRHARTDDKGVARFELKTPDAAGMRLLAQLTGGNADGDAHGETGAADRYDLVIASGDRARHAMRSNGVMVLTDRLIYEPGATARVMVVARKASSNALLTVGGDALHTVRPVKLKRGLQFFDIKIPKDSAGAVTVAINDTHDPNDWRSNTFEAFWRSNAFEAFVYPHKRVLEVSVAADQSAYEPGAEARITVRTRAAGAGVPAEVELAVVDEAIYQLAENNVPPIRPFFLAPVRRWNRWHSPMRMHSDLLRFDESPPTYGYGGGQGGLFGASGAGRASSVVADSTRIVARSGFSGAHPEIDTRRRFRDTAYWAAHLETDADGKAVTTIRMPDDLTRWRLVARAVTDDHRFGEAESDTLTRKDVLARLIGPRFLVNGDRTRLATLVHNHTDKPGEFKVRLTTEPGALTRSSQREPRTITVPAHGSRRVEWPIVAQRPGTMTLRTAVTSPRGNDAVEKRIDIQPMGVDQWAVTGGALRDQQRFAVHLPDHALPRQGELEIGITSSPIEAVRQALPYLADYPHGCVEQTMSRFVPALAAKRAMDELDLKHETLGQELPNMVRAGIDRLRELQRDEGGWGWWSHDETRSSITAYVCFGLLKAKESGADVSDRMLERGLSALRHRDGGAFSLYVRSLAGEELSHEWSRAKIKTLRQHAYAALAGREKHVKPLLEASLPKRPTSENVQRVALVLRALHLHRPGHEAVARRVAWLMRHRRGVRWVSTLDTAHVILAFAQVADGPSAAKPRLLVNGERIGDSPGSYTVPRTKLRTGKNVIEVENTGDTAMYLSARLRYQAPPSKATGGGAIAVERSIERVVFQPDKGWQTEPMAEGAPVQPGALLLMRVKVRSDAGQSHVMVEAPFPAGVEPVLLDEDDDRRELVRAHYANRRIRDSRAGFAFFAIGKHPREAKLLLRVTRPGAYQVLPATAFAMYAPNQRGWTGGARLTVERPQAIGRARPRRDDASNVQAMLKASKDAGSN